MFKAIKSKILTLGIFGGLFGGAGAAGAFGVCHSLCAAAIAALAVVGITGIGMPFLFMQETWFQVLSWGLAGVSLLSAAVLWQRHRRHGQKCCPPGQKEV